MKTDDTREETFARKWGKGGNASSSQKRQHLTKIVATTTTYLDVRDRINRGDASGRAKLGIDKSIHACVILFLVASVRKFGEEEKIPKIRKGVTTENCETKKVNMKRREKEAKFIRGSKNTNTRRFRSFNLCVP